MCPVSLVACLFLFWNYHLYVPRYLSIYFFAASISLTEELSLLDQVEYEAFLPINIT